MSGNYLDPADQCALYDEQKRKEEAFRIDELRKRPGQVTPAGNHPGGVSNNTGLPQFKETEEQITLHGLGFIQVKLGGNQRLHVWHPELPRRKCFCHSQIHDHRFSFESRILVGSMENICFTVKSADQFTGTHAAYRHEGERTQFGNRPWLLDEYLRVERGLSAELTAGETYHMDDYRFHATNPLGDGRVATIMRKKHSGNVGARSLCSIGVEPDVDFDRKQLPSTDLWAFVLNVLGAGETEQLLLTTGYC